MKLKETKRYGKNQTFWPTQYLDLFKSSAGTGDCELCIFSTNSFLRASLSGSFSTLYFQKKHGKPSVSEYIMEQTVSVWIWDVPGRIQLP